MGGGGPGAAVVSAEEAAADSERGTASEQSKHAFSGFMSVVNGIANMLGMKGALPVGYLPLSLSYLSSLSLSFSSSLLS